MRVFDGLDELEQAVGTHLGYSGWHPVTQEQVDRFAEVTGDRQWIHVDPARAAGGPFGTAVAHGFLTLAMAPMLTWEVYRVDGMSTTVNYGCNKVRFPAPVPVGSRVRAGVELVSLVPRGSGRQATTRVVIERAGTGKPVCAAEFVSMLMP